MKLYRKLIRPMHCYPGQHYEPLTEPIEKEEKWYPEEERECLEKKYASYNEGSFSDLIFEEKYEPYAVEPKFKKLKVPEKCGECKSCQAAITGSPYCHMEAVSSVNSQMDISSIYVDVDSRPVWCPIIKMNNELDRMPFEKRAELTAEKDLFTPRTFYHLSSSMFYEMCELLKEQVCEDHTENGEKNILIKLVKKAVECCKISKCSDCPFKSFPSECMSILENNVSR